MKPELETPAAATAVFPGDRLALAERYVASLATDGIERGLIGPREAPRLWDRHVLNCAVLQEAVPQGASVADVGSGAGLPGLVVAIARPDASVTLVEPLLRRTTYLSLVVDDLELENVTVVRGRAEEIRRTVPRFDVVTARAVAPLDRLAGWCLPLVARGGVLLAIKGSSAADEVAEAARAVRKLGGQRPEVLELGRGIVDPPTTVVRVARRDDA
ncbi:16S rRNA (guanine(527)-N(7))-methyltransferase RsmG [Nocardioides marinquilinus]|uniref:Ribosomal RNA small subunit methyltransferase G n=1 Tax=Nocardioides marinquilinus TaxID=1210400 RepID=A0ABP9P4A9_9ACTN